MTTRSTQQSYAQATGNAPTNWAFINNRNPLSTDVNYPLGQFWINISNQTIWYLASFSSPSGNLTASWQSMGLPPLTDGQVVIGSSIGPPLAETLTAGSNITITNGHNSITIAASTGSVSWTDEASSFNAASGNGYFVTAALTVTLPPSPSQGDVVRIIVDTASTCTIQASPGQVIRIGSGASSIAGTAASNARCDALFLVYRAADTSWINYGPPQGTWTLT